MFPTIISISYLPLARASRLAVLPSLGVSPWCILQKGNHAIIWNQVKWGPFTFRHLAQPPAPLLVQLCAVHPQVRDRTDVGAEFAPARNIFGRLAVCAPRTRLLHFCPLSFPHSLLRLQSTWYTGSCKRNVPLFENSRPGAARQFGQPMPSQSGNFRKFNLNSLNLAPFLLLNPVREISFFRVRPPFLLLLFLLQGTGASFAEANQFTCLN